MTDWCEVSEETLSAFVDGELSPRQQRRLACHIADCAVCSQRLGRLYAMKSYMGSAEQYDTSVPAGLWTRVRMALDTVDRVARSLPQLAPRPVPAWRLPALVAVGVLLIIAALYTRQLVVMRPTTAELLAQAHHSAITVLPAHQGLGRYQAISTDATTNAWQPVRTALVRVDGGLGEQRVYQVGPAVLSYFSLPDRAFEPDTMLVLHQGRRLFYVGTTAELSVVAWRQPEGWGALVAHMYPDQLLPLAEMYVRSVHLHAGF